MNIQYGGVIMDVINAEQAKIAEVAGAIAVMAAARARRPTIRTRAAAVCSDRAERRARYRRRRATGFLLAHRISCAVCQKRCRTFSSTTIRGIAARISEGGGTMNRLMAPVRIRSSTSAMATMIDATRKRGRPSATRATTPFIAVRPSSPRRFVQHAGFVVCDPAARFGAQILPDFRDVLTECGAADHL